MRILVASTSFPVTSGSSSGVFVERLIDTFEERCNVEVITPAYSRPENLTSNYKVHCFRYAPRRFQILAHEPGGLPVALRNNSWAFIFVPLFLSSFFISLWKLSKGKELIFANWSLSGLLAGLVGKLRGIPVCTTFRGEDVSNLESSSLRGFLVRCVLRLNSHVFCVSDAMRLDLKARFPDSAHKISHIPNGVGNEFLQIKPTARLQGELKLVSIGSLIPRKNIPTILQALAKADESVKLDIVGDGPEKDKLVDLARALNIDGRVRFLGQVSSSDIAKVVSRYDALVLASKSEGRPNVVLEAMAASCCVICSSLPGTEELIVHKVSGLLFDSTDSITLASYFGELMDDPDLSNQLGRQARQHIIRQRLTWNDCGQNYYEMFCQIIQGH